MRRLQHSTAIGLLLLGALSSGTLAWAARATPEHVEYWRETYKELKPEEDPRVGKARTIFGQLLQVAGKRPEAAPRLLVVKETKQEKEWSVALPVALPDGWIVLSNVVLDRLYADSTRGDDRLAFVLAHEIAHQLHDDFWHVKFFQIFKASLAQGVPGSSDLRDIYERLREPEYRKRIWEQELQADRRGIWYAALAGFNTQAIVTPDATVNFFRDWVQARDPSRLPGMVAEPSHPTPRQRAQLAHASLHEIVEQLPQFQAGLWFAQAGMWERAVQAFTVFQQVFPSREVAHNLGTSHHHLALQAYHQWQPIAPAMPFHLTLTLEPETRATQLASSGVQRYGTRSAKERFDEHLRHAVEAYQTAIAADPAYVPAYNNLGCALLLHGTAKGFHDAVTKLLEAHERFSSSPAIQNNLGVAYWYVQQPDQAKQYLHAAHRAAAMYGAPLRNLEQIALAANQPAEAAAYRQASERLERPPVTSTPAAGTGVNQVDGLAIGATEKAVPQTWGSPQPSNRRVGEELFTFSRYPNRVDVLWWAGTVLMLHVPAGSPALRAGALAGAYTVYDVRTRYGPPDQILELGYAQSWRYATQGLAVHLRDGQVVSWLLYPH